MCSSDLDRVDALAADLQEVGEVLLAPAALGAQVASDDRATPRYLGTFVKSETEKWAGPIKASGAQVE